MHRELQISLPLNAIVHDLSGKIEHCPGHSLPPVWGIHQSRIRIFCLHALTTASSTIFTALLSIAIR
ncbi:hypothetical protein HYPSUDRAFT_46903 [Hypholoma sublateritium FD-334 SS-4]|uniref:Uncharacterized protein n=1 Tax=Hypholoma sublateritium (strain FD-334 SS-4) TaxID=945553 RepID=A0A0D2NCQ0_HYPSF|nr:hypothetical protein HYPSUDRAFT_46903 [Hypholoma sublateritium FD-334 SS-4]